MHTVKVVLMLTIYSMEVCFTLFMYQSNFRNKEHNTFQKYILTRIITLHFNYRLTTDHLMTVSIQPLFALSSALFGFVSGEVRLCSVLCLVKKNSIQNSIDKDSGLVRPTTTRLNLVLKPTTSRFLIPTRVRTQSECSSLFSNSPRLVLDRSPTCPRKMVGVWSFGHAWKISPRQILYPDTKLITDGQSRCQTDVKLIGDQSMQITDRMGKNLYLEVGFGSVWRCEGSKKDNEPSSMRNYRLLLYWLFRFFFNGKSLANRLKHCM